jgi:hypothetical protein
VSFAPTKLAFVYPLLPIGKVERKLSEISAYHSVLGRLRPASDERDTLGSPLQTHEAD